MPKLPKVSSRVAETITSLFIGKLEMADLAAAFQTWDRGNIELSDEQIRRAAAKIEAVAIPNARRFAGDSPAGPLREEADEILATWIAVLAMLRASTSKR